MKEKNDAIMEDVETIITSLGSSFNDELFSKDKDGLEEYWHFEFNAKLKARTNMYEFHKMLSLYGNFCRRWEERHNGNCCVVERVRDQYLIPKIEVFIEQFLISYGA